MNNSPKISATALTELASDIQAQLENIAHARPLSDSQLVALYFEVGALIDKSDLDESDVAALSESLSNASAIGDFSAANLLEMARFFRAYGHHTVLQSLMDAIDWPKHLAILNECRDEKAQEFYIRMSRKFNWSLETLKEKLESFRPSA